jgi:hypothetical protein
MNSTRTSLGPAAALLILLWGLAGGLAEPFDGAESLPIEPSDVPTPRAPTLRLLCEVNGTTYVPRSVWPPNGDLRIGLTSHRAPPPCPDGADRALARQLRCFVIEP